MKLWQKIFIGLITGVILGAVLKEHALILKPIGTLFINAIKMLIVPLVFSSLVVGVTSMQDTRKMGRIGVKTFCIYMLTTCAAITIGLTMGTVFQPGKHLNMTAPLTQTVVETPSLMDTLVNLIPSNPVTALASGNILQIIVFAILLGIAINLTGKKADPVKHFMTGLSEIMYQLTAMVMELAPYGVCALMAWVAGSYGLDVLLPLGKVVLALYIGSILHIVLVLGGALLLIGKLNPIQFFKGIADAQMVAFTTTSSSGTLPITMECAEENLGVSKNISSFVLPLGATINMDGTALYQGVAALFVAQAYGIDLSLGHYVTIILTATLASIGTAGVPGAGLIMLSLVLSSVGLPLEGVAVVAGIDRILDMARTTVNVTGDAMVSVLVAKTENEFNPTIYNHNPEI